jgi:hypothetical protein
MYRGNLDLITTSSPISAALERDNPTSGIARQWNMRHAHRKWGEKENVAHITLS